MSATAHCQDCGSEVGDQRHCGVCGQRTGEPVPTVRGLFSQFVDDFLSLDSKLARTLGSLLRRPGALTVEYLSGRQTRYVRPLRLYLLCSIWFFLLVTWTGGGTIVRTGVPSETAVEASTVAPGEAHADPPAVARALRRAAFAEPVRRSLHAAFEEAAFDSLWIAAVAVDSARGTELEEIERFPVLGRPIADKLRSLSNLGSMEFEQIINRAVVTNLPKAIFALVPVFALVLALVYLRSRRRYAEHFVFALHVHAFAFLIFSAMLLSPWEPLDVLLLVSVVAYIALSMRKVYAQRWPKTLVKFVGLLMAYQVLMLGALVATIVVSLLTL